MRRFFPPRSVSNHTKSLRNYARCLIQTFVTEEQKKWKKWFYDSKTINNKRFFFLCFSARHSCKPSVLKRDFQNYYEFYQVFFSLLTKLSKVWDILCRKCLSWNNVIKTNLEPKVLEKHSLTLTDTNWIE